eukprot:c53842_g1_i1 orf=220-1155(+)
MESSSRRNEESYAHQQQDSNMLKPVANQVAGHQAGAGQIGPLVDGTGKFYKPLQKGERGERELQFYKQFFADHSVPDEVKASLPWFYGTANIESCDGSGPYDYLILEDLTHNFHHPAVMDIKMGKRTWYPGAREKYIQKCLEKDKETTSTAIGFRISGMQVYDATHRNLWKPDRNWCKQLSPDTIKAALKYFISSNPGSKECPDKALASIVYGSIKGIIHQLLELKKWFEQQTQYHFYSSSILFIYECDPPCSNLGGETIHSPLQLVPLVKMIDFAHVLVGQNCLDENFLEGLKSLICYLTQVVKESLIAS